MGVQPFHEVVPNRSILETMLWDIQNYEKGQTRVQCPVVVAGNLSCFRSGLLIELLSVCISQVETRTAVCTQHSFIKLT